MEQIEQTLSCSERIPQLFDRYLESIWGTVNRMNEMEFIQILNDIHSMFYPALTANFGYRNEKKDVYFSNKQMDR